MFGTVRGSLSVILCTLLVTGYGQAAERCAHPIASVVTMQGAVEWRAMDQTIWRSATFQTDFCPGDHLRVVQSATLRLSNETILRLNAGALVKLGDEKPGFWVELLRGAAYFLTRTPNPFLIEAPYVNAAIEGTEFVIEHTHDADRITILEGQVRGSNAMGSMTASNNEQIVANPNQAPTRLVDIDMLEQANWVLYAPPLLSVQDLSEELQRELYRGNYYAVYQALKQKQNLDGNAGALALYFGDHALADSAIQSLPDPDPGRIAIEMMRALTTRDLQTAKTRTETLLSNYPTLPLTHSVASWFLQASTKLPAALQAAQQAANLDAENPLAHARVAELSLSLGRHAEARSAIRKAQEFGDLPRVHVFQGVLFLQQGYTGRAQQAFKLARDLDASDPLAHFAFGLTLIQQNLRKAGRVSIENAVALDPGNSLFRSYLAKTYALERRMEKANTQLALAQQLDPDDPTHWLYRALIEQNQQRYIPALRSVNKAIEKNQGRAIQRSRFQLDTDAAIKNANLANIYLRLGLNTQASRIANQSIQVSPTDYSSHKILADTLNLGMRQDSAAASEFLQAQIRQPVQTIPLDPLRAEQGLLVNQSFAPYQPGLTEYTTLFNRQGIQGHVSLGAGNRTTQNQSAFVSGVAERFAAAVSAYNYTTEGDAADFARDYRLASLFLKGQVYPGVNLLLEGRTRETDLALANNISTDNLEDFHSETDFLRVGLRDHKNPEQEWILIIDKISDDSGIALENRIAGQGITLLNTSTTQDEVVVSELQTTRLFEHFNSTLGIRAGQIDRAQQRHNQVIGTPFPQVPSIQSTTSEIDLKHAYLYLRSQAVKNLDIDVGLSYTAFEDNAIMSSDEKDWQMKLGAFWQANPQLRLRAAYFEQVQAPTEINQSLEPTQVGGFNQFYDVANYIRSENIGLGTEVSFGENVYWETQGLRKTLDWSRSLDLNASLQNLEIEESRVQSEWVWLANDKLSYRFGMQVEEQSYARGNVPTNLPASIETQTLGQRLFYSVTNPLSLVFELDWVKQKTRFLSSEGTTLNTDSKFWISNLELRYRFAANRWEVSLQGRNLANKNFGFQDANIIDGQKRSLRYLPERTIAFTIKAQL